MRCISLYLAAALVMALSLAGCGQKGDLYLPDDSPQKKEKQQS